MNTAINGRRSEHLMIALFKGIGDFIAAAPSIKEALKIYETVTVVVFPQLREVVSMVDFGEGEKNLHIVEIPSGSGISSIFRFVRLLLRADANIVWISPHAARRVASWKFPLVLILLRTIFRRRMKIYGATTEPLACFFDNSIQLDRNLPLAIREWEGISRISNGFSNDRPCAINFKTKAVKSEVKNRTEIIIHAGASRLNKRWPVRLVGQLIEDLHRDANIMAIGSPSELNEIRAVLPSHVGISYKSGALAEIVDKMNGCQLAITMDSGIMHLAGVLKLPTIALFGSTSPDAIVDRDSSVLPIFEKTHSCQPCFRNNCIYDSPKCMNEISPVVVAKEARSILAKIACGPE